LFALAANSLRFFPLSIRLVSSANSIVLNFVASARSLI
jgi:hypothetical protein